MKSNTFSGNDKTDQAAGSSRAISQTHEVQAEHSHEVDESTLAVPGSVGQSLKLVALRPVGFWGDVTHGLADKDDSDTEGDDDFTFEALDWVTQRMEPVKFWGARGQLSDYIFPVPCSGSDDIAAEDIEALCIGEEAV